MYQKSVDDSMDASFVLELTEPEHNVTIDRDVSFSFSLALLKTRAARITEGSIRVNFTAGFAYDAVARQGEVRPNDHLPYSTQRTPARS